MKQNILTVIFIPALFFSANVAAIDLGHGVALRGFGTIGMAASTNRDADYVVNPVTQGEGAGRSNGITYGVDSKVGMQLDWQATDRISFTGQGISKQFEDRTWTPRLEWAFAKFKAFSSLDIRAGRIRPSIYMLSDYLDVNYANTWVRPPSDHYSVVSITNMEGVDLLWRPKTGPINWLVQPFYGNTTVTTTPSERFLPTNSFDADHIAGISVTGSYSDFTFRLGYAHTYLSLHSNSFETKARPGLQQICGLGDRIACSQLNALALDDKDASFSSIGMTWDNGDYFVTGEAGRRRIDSYVADTTSWYLSAGARFDKFTPYGTFSQLLNDSPTKFTGDSTGRLGATTNQISTALLTNNIMNQHTISFGVRYDFYKNLALKFQWDRIDTQTVKGQPGTGGGVFAYTTTAFANNNNSVDLFSVTTDFVF